MKDDDLCPCGGGPWLQCCGRWSTDVPPDGPEALMRARYVAYTRGDAAVLLGTWHPASRPPKVDFDADTTWLGLKISEVKHYGEDQATVQFTARWRVGGGKAERMTETSRFVRVHGLWWYLDGKIEGAEG
ncbi:YchJ family protein [Polycyclovorans algicola]|uniref:YchJ family protein n=1 Tax=Polycyclovorans algicola TaxID=616992 RepID=UPI0004A6FEE3|nr:YchJ family metal-binding protein [Polycyclovorans algicola]